MARPAPIGNTLDGDAVSDWKGFKPYANRSDPLNRFRDCNTEPITLYYFGNDKDRVAEEGFQEPDPIGYGTENPKSGFGPGQPLRHLACVVNLAGGSPHGIHQVTESLISRPHRKQSFQPLDPPCSSRHL